MPATYEINFQEAERMSELLRRYPEIAGYELRAAMTDSVRKTTLEIQKRTPVYTTKLRRSIAGEVEVQGLLGAAGREALTNLEPAPHDID